MPRNLKKGKSLGELYPELVKEWHPTKNGDLSPFDFTYASNKRVWWKCDKADDHEWSTKIGNRTILKRGCPCCKNKKVSITNSLSSLRPDLAKEWHPTKNGNINPENVIVKSGKKYWWKCHNGKWPNGKPANDHIWEASAHKRANGRGCPYCSGQKITNSNCLATTHPEISKEWHPTKNVDKTPYDIGYGHESKVWWKCYDGKWPDGTFADDHEWKATPNHRTNMDVGCPVCANKKIVKSNCLAVTHPDLAKQWHPTKNNDLTPHDVSIGSHQRVSWRCNKNKQHEWKTAIKNRKVNNCPYCFLTPQSREELIITHELITIFKGINPKGFKTWVKGKLRSIDIYIPMLKLGIEFDGKYWHKGKRALDKLKTEELEAEGFNIIRVRQKPLKRIFDDDVMADKKYNGKKITNDILKKILKDYQLDKSTITKIHMYIEKPTLQNEKGLDKYIDMILKEKADRKK